LRRLERAVAVAEELADHVEESTDERRERASLVGGRAKKRRDASSSCADGARDDERTPLGTSRVQVRRREETQERTAFPASSARTPASRRESTSRPRRR